MTSVASAISAPWRWSARPTCSRRGLTAARIVMRAPSRVLPLDVERDEDDGALDHLGDLLRDPVRDERVLEELQHRRADDRAPHRDAAACERRPRDGDRRDRVE